MRIALALLCIVCVSLLFAACRPKPAPAVSPLSPLSIPVSGTAMLPINLLANPGFEGNYHIQDGVNEVNVPDGWRAWYVDTPWCRPLKPGCDIPCPSNCLIGSSSVLDVDDGVVSAGPASMTIGTPAVVTVTLVATRPVGTIELKAAFNPVLMSSRAVSIAEDTTRLDQQPGIVAYEREAEEYSTVGVIEMFSMTVTPTRPGTVTFEIGYFAGNPDGGAYDDGWQPWKETRRFVTQTIVIGDDLKCSSNTGCYWARPEFVPINQVDNPERVRNGERAQKYFSVGRMHRAGMMQQVAVQPGTWLMFSAWMHAWQCYDWEACCNGQPYCISDQPASIGLRVGIDPSGGTDPAAGTVVWSPPGEAFDVWREFVVSTWATSPTVTVFTQSDARFDFARVNNDVYLDDAQLVEAYPVFLPVVILNGG